MTGRHTAEVKARIGASVHQAWLRKQKPSVAIPNKTVRIYETSVDIKLTDKEMLKLMRKGGFKIKVIL